MLGCNSLGVQVLQEMLLLLGLLQLWHPATALVVPKGTAQSSLPAASPHQGKTLLYHKLTEITGSHVRNPEIRTSRTYAKRKQYPGECLAESGFCCSSGKTIFSLHLAPKIHTLLAIKRVRCLWSYCRNMRNTILALPISTCQDCCKMLLSFSFPLCRYK